MLFLQLQFLFLRDLARQKRLPMRTASALSRVQQQSAAAAAAANSRHVNTKNINEKAVRSKHFSLHEQGAIAPERNGGDQDASVQVLNDTSPSFKQTVLAEALSLTRASGVLQHSPADNEQEEEEEEQQQQQSLHSWERMFNLDREVQSRIEEQFAAVVQKLVELERHFEGQGEVARRLEQSCLNLLRAMRGAPFLKVSRSNQKDAHVRTLFYSANLEAVCWRDPKQRFPREEQVLFVRDIASVCAKASGVRVPTPYQHQFDR
jgi:hypothetical protein